jgi:hypothetical protein
VDVVVEAEPVVERGLRQDLHRGGGARHVRAEREPAVRLDDDRQAGDRALDDGRDLLGRRLGAEGHVARAGDRVGRELEHVVGVAAGDPERHLVAAEVGADGDLAVALDDHRDELQRLVEPLRHRGGVLVARLEDDARLDVAHDLDVERLAADEARGEDGGALHGRARGLDRRGLRRAAVHGDDQRVAVLDEERAPVRAGDRAGRRRRGAGGEVAEGADRRRASPGPTRRRGARCARPRAGCRRSRRSPSRRARGRSRA